MNPSRSDPEEPHSQRFHPGFEASIHRSGTGFALVDDRGRWIAADVESWREVQP